MVEIPPAIKQALKDYLLDLAQHYRLGRVILFGSLAQGRYGPHSDIDLAIFSADVTDDNQIDIMADCLLRAMPYHLDIQSLVYPLADYEADNDFIQQEIIGWGVELPLPVVPHVDTDS